MVHLRLCLSCGHVGCCDSPPNRHATKHFHLTEHPVIASFEPGERCRTGDAERAQAGRTVFAVIRVALIGNVGPLPEVAQWSQRSRVMKGRG
jgi:methylphosphotriester-DNA--protein-cysteine methyltransferase